MLTELGQGQAQASLCKSLGQTLLLEPWTVEILNEHDEEVLYACSNGTSADRLAFRLDKLVESLKEQRFNDWYTTIQNLKQEHVSNRDSFRLRKYALETRLQTASRSTSTTRYNRWMSKYETQEQAEQKILDVLSVEQESMFRSRRLVRSVQMKSQPVTAPLQSTRQTSTKAAPFTSEKASESAQKPARQAVVKGERVDSTAVMVQVEPVNVAPALSVQKRHSKKKKKKKKKKKNRKLAMKINEFGVAALTN